MTEESVVATLLNLKSEPALKKSKCIEVPIFTVGHNLSNHPIRRYRGSRANSSRRKGHWNKDLLLPLISLVAEDITSSDDDCNVSLSDPIGYYSESCLSAISASNDSHDDFVQRWKSRCNIHT